MSNNLTKEAAGIAYARCLSMHKEIFMRHRNAILSYMLLTAISFPPSKPYGLSPVEFMALQGLIEFMTLIGGRAHENLWKKYHALA